MLKLKVGFVDGKGFTCEVGANDDVDKLKEIVLEKKGSGFEVERQRIITSGCQLDGGRTWRDYGIADGSTIHIVCKSAP